MREIIQGMGKSGIVSYRCPLGLPWSKGGFPSSCREADFNTADLLQALSVPQLIPWHTRAQALRHRDELRFCFALLAKSHAQALPKFAGALVNLKMHLQTDQTFFFFLPEEFSIDKGTVASGPEGVNVCGSTAERSWTGHMPGCCGLCATTSQQMEALGPWGQCSLCQGPLQQKTGC